MNIKKIKKLCVCAILVGILIAIIYFIVGLFMPEKGANIEIYKAGDMIEEIQQKEKYRIRSHKQYIGLYVEDPIEYEEKFDNNFNVVGWFETLDGRMKSDNKLKEGLENRKYIPFISLEPEGMNLNDIASGKYDKELHTFFQRVTKGKRDEVDLFVRFGHEMEMRPGYHAWYNWQTYDSNAYIRAWRHVVTLARQYAPNIKWVWSPNRADGYTRAYYPGSEYVDYVSLTLNNTRNRTFTSFYKNEGTENQLKAYGKPIIIGECATSYGDDITRANYLKEIIEYVKNDEYLVGAVIFDKDVDHQRMYKWSDSEYIVNEINSVLKKEWTIYESK